MMRSSANSWTDSWQRPYTPPTDVPDNKKAGLTEGLLGLYDSSPELAMGHMALVPSKYAASFLGA
jgi:hypothetical protein